MCHSTCHPYGVVNDVMCRVAAGSASTGSACHPTTNVQECKANKNTLKIKQTNAHLTPPPRLAVSRQITTRNAPRFTLHASTKKAVLVGVVTVTKAWGSTGSLSLSSLQHYHDRNKDIGNPIDVHLCRLSLCAMYA